MLRTDADTHVSKEYDRVEEEVTVSRRFPKAEEGGCCKEGSGYSPRTGDQIAGVGGGVSVQVSGPTLPRGVGWVWGKKGQRWGGPAPGGGGGGYQDDSEDRCPENTIRVSGHATTRSTYPVTPAQCL